VNFIAALKFCFKTCVAMKFVDDDDDDRIFNDCSYDIFVIIIVYCSSCLSS